ncbi:MAG: hypothetical protein KGZ96_10555 [Clostridia bacterium]|nr:hypothetical protein [Clostridia bacterium]
MGFWDNFKNKYLQQQPTQSEISYIPSILPTVAVESVKNGQLPQINTNTVFLSAGEHVHYIEKAIMITEKNMITGYTGGISGWSFRVMKGVSYRTGSRQGIPIREDVQEQTRGILYITSKRILFVAKKHGFDKNINAISAVMPYANGISLQFGNATHTIMLPDGNIAFAVINMLKP